MKTQPKSSVTFCSYIYVLLSYRCKDIPKEERIRIYKLISDSPTRHVERATIEELKDIQRDVPFLKFLNSLKKHACTITYDHTAVCDTIHLVFKVHDHIRHLYIDITGENWEQKAHLDLFYFLFNHLHQNSMGKITLLHNYLFKKEIPKGRPDR
ncbi:MAG: hypothetical protein ACRCX2_05725 [Paraclostridium sp.]